MCWLDAQTERHPLTAESSLSPAWIQQAAHSCRQRRSRICKSGKSGPCTAVTVQEPDFSDFQMGEGRCLHQWAAYWARKLIAAAGKGILNALGCTTSWQRRQLSNWRSIHGPRARFQRLSDA